MKCLLESVMTCAVNLKPAVILSLLVCLVCGWMPAWADNEHDAQVWQLLQLTVPLNEDKKLKGYLELQPRFTDNVTDLEQIQTRFALGYQATEKLSVWQGYMIVPEFDPNLELENRLYQQLNYETKLGKADINHRVRLEQRFFDSNSGVSLRDRYQVKGYYPVGKTDKWSLVGYDEIFFHLNNLASGPTQGFDQNRLFMGLARQMNKQTRLEGGYLLQYSNVQGSPDNRINHILMMTLNISL